MEHDGVVAAIVMKKADGQKTIVSSADMIGFSEAHVEVIPKNGKSYIMLTEK